MIHKITIPVGGTLGGGSSSGFNNPMTSPGDIIVGGSLGQANRLPVITSIQPSILTSVNNSTYWTDLSSLIPVNLTYSTVIGDGINKDIQILHNLNTEQIIVGTWETGGLKRSIACSVSIVSNNIITLHFNSIPTISSIRVTIISSIFGSSGGGAGGTTSLPNQSGYGGSFLKTNGTSASWSPIVFPQELPPQTGNIGKYLTTDGSIASWNNLPPWPNPMTASGDLIIGGVLGAASRLGRGTEAQVLATIGNTLVWVTQTWMTNPMSQAGDLIIGGAFGASGRLARGADNQVLTVSGSSLIWTTQVPSVSTNSGKVLSNDGLNTLWKAINEVPTISIGDNTKILSNNGTTSLWITNTAPPDLTGNSSKFLTNNGTVTSWASIAQVPATLGQAGKLLSNDGGSYSWNNLVSVMPTVTAQGGKFLTTDGIGISWAVPPTGFNNPMTTAGDLIVGGTSGSATRLAIGTNGYILTIAAGSPTWVAPTTPPPSLTNPMVTVGDLIIGGVSGGPTRLSIGANGTILQSNGASPNWISATVVPAVTGHPSTWLYSDGTSAYWSAFTTIPSQTGYNNQFLKTDGINLLWAAIPAGFANPMTTLGDMISSSTGGSPSRLPIGTNGQVLTVISGSSGWANNVIGLPSQATNGTKFLTTDGLIPSWSNIYQVPTVVGQSGKFLGNDGINYSWLNLPNQLPTVVGQTGKYLSNNGIVASWEPYSGIPSITGNAGKVLSTDAVTTFWITPSGAGTALSRIPITVTTSNLPVLTGETKTIDTTCKTFQVYKVTANYPCRLRIYGTLTAASLDYSRTVSNDPTGNHLMYLELVLSQSNLTWTMSPVPTCANMDAITTTNTYMTIENTDSASRIITLNFELLKLE